MKNTTSGIEIEFTGITRTQAAKTLAAYFNSTVEGPFCHLNERRIKDSEGRDWKIMSDSSIRAEKKINGQTASASEEYKVELVTPIITYAHDLDTLQELVRALRTAGAFTNDSAGIHIHVDGAGHTARDASPINWRLNFMNIIYSRNDRIHACVNVFTNALEIASERQRFCKKLDKRLVESLNQRKPKTLSALEDLWYENNRWEPRDSHYNGSRYAFLNLHSFFHGNGSLEIRGFNSTLHAGKIRAYWVLTLAMNQQALTQKSASAKKPQTENEKFAMRTYLNRIGLSGEEFKNCKQHAKACC